VETRKVVVRLVHWSGALDIIAKSIAMTAGKETATCVELGNPAAAISSTSPSPLVRSVYLGENMLCANGEYEVQPLLACLDLLHEARVRLPSHPFWLRRRRPFWPIITSSELAVETRKVVVCLIHRPDALDIIAEPIAMAAGK
jgi:hypothetical protein